MYKALRTTAVTAAIVALCIMTTVATMATAFTIPNPRGDRAEAERCGYVDSVFWTSSNYNDGAARHVCSPDRILSANNILAIDRVIAQQRDYFDVGVVVLEKMPKNFAKGKPRDERARLMAEIIHDSWGVGNPEDGLGTVFFIAVDDRVMYISNGKGVAARVSAEDTAAVIEVMKPHMRNGACADAVISGILELCDKFIRTTPPSAPYAARTDVGEGDEYVEVHVHYAKHAMSEDDLLVIFGIVLITLTFFCYVVAVCVSSDEQEQKEARRRQREIAVEAEAEAELRSRRNRGRSHSHSRSRDCNVIAPLPTAPPPPPAYAASAPAPAPAPAPRTEVHHHHHTTERHTSSNNYYGGNTGWGLDSLWNTNRNPRPVVVHQPAPTVVVATRDSGCPRPCDRPTVVVAKNCDPCDRADRIAAVTTALKKTVTNVSTRPVAQTRSIPKETYEGGTHEGGNGAAGTW